MPLLISTCGYSAAMLIAQKRRKGVTACLKRFKLYQVDKTELRAVARKTTYRDAGVNIDEADRAVARIKRLASQTLTREVLTSIGSVGAGFNLKGWRDPVLVSSADGVGTRLKIAFATGRHNTIREDLVNHCVNDIAVQGAKPLFFLTATV